MPAHLVVPRANLVPPPVSGARAQELRRAAPFLATLVLCTLAPAIPHSTDPIVGWWLGAVGVFAFCVVLGVAGTLSDRAWLIDAAVLLILPGIQLLRASDGNATSGFSPVLLLPILWFALFGARELVIVTVLGAGAVMALPLLLIGAPQYPTTSIRGAALLWVLIATVGLLVHRLVDAARAEAVVAAEHAELFRSVFDGTPVGLAVTNGPVSGGSHFTLANTALCGTIGADQQEVAALPLRALIDADDLAAVLDRVTVQAEGVEPVEARLRTRSGRTVWTAVSATPLKGARTNDATLWQIVDITAKRAADNTLLDALDVERRAGDALRTTDRQRRELLAAISHDLRTPVTAAHGFAELLSDGHFGPLTDKQASTVDIIFRSLGNLSRIITELNTTAPDLAREIGPANRLDLGPLVDAALEMISLQAARRDQQVVRTGDHHGLVIAGDEVLLSRVLVNLLVNAVKFSPAGATIGLDVTREQNHAAISISDNGPGISPADQHRIFDRFYRAPRQNVDPGGSGLGLAIVRAIIQQHHGSIDLMSSPGHGTTFTIHLPLLDAEEVDRTVASRAPGRID